MKSLVLGVLAACLILVEANAVTNSTKPSPSTFKELLNVWKEKAATVLDSIEKKIDEIDPLREPDTNSTIPPEQLIASLKVKTNKILDALAKKITEIDPLKKAQARMANITSRPADSKYCVDRERCKIDIVFSDLQVSISNCLRTASEKSKIIIQDLLRVLSEIAASMTDIETELKKCESHVVSVLRWSCLAREIEIGCKFLKNSKVQIRIKLNAAIPALENILKELDNCSACAEKIVEVDFSDIRLSIVKCNELHQNKKCAVGVHL